jgi:hypothetical protein
VSLKVVEVVVLVCAGGLFVWWQMRDLRIARENTRQQRLAEQAARGESVDGGPHAP